MCCAVKINGSGSLIPSCTYAVTEGMRIESETDEITEARRKNLQLLLSQHRGECLAPCERVCPVQGRISHFLQQTAIGNLSEAAGVLHIALPKITCALCHAPCEKACRLQKIKGKTNTVHIRAVSRHIIKNHLKYFPPVVKLNQKIAVIGSGPAGLGAAWILAGLGYEVYVYEKDFVIGPSIAARVHQHPHIAELLEQEIADMKNSGVVFHTCAVLPADGHFKGILNASGNNNILYNETTVVSAGSALKKISRPVDAIGSGVRQAELLHSILAGTSHPQYCHLAGPVNNEELNEYSKTASSLSPQTVSDDETCIQESGRCLTCGCSAAYDGCALRTQATSLKIKSTGIRHADNSSSRTHTSMPITRTVQDRLCIENAKCIKCGVCIAITRNTRNGFYFSGRGFHMTICLAAAENSKSCAEGTISTGILNECVAHCPTGALYWK